MKNRILFAVLVLSGLFMPLHAQQDNIVDSVDVLDYDLVLDVGNHTQNRIEGSAAVTMRVLQPVDSIGLELKLSEVDSVLVDGVNTGFGYEAPLLKVPFSGSVGDTVVVTVFYRKGQYIAPNGWGGFYFDNNIYYNLGIAIYEYPHNIGKAWFPCRDNFYDKATYRFRITAKPGWQAICTGVKVSEVEYDDHSLVSEWVLGHPTPTYLVGVAVADFNTIDTLFNGNDTVYPGLLGYLNHSTSGVQTAFGHMNKVIPMYERCFGPYRWDRVGYVSTPKGSMEHVGNIAFTTQCMASDAEACLATMSHEFAHSWFGNLITCATAADMWINEGGASFCEELAVQAIYADTDPMRYKVFADENLSDVLLQAHINDNGFKPLYGQTPEYTYGTTVYDKGATVWHSLRGYVGDSLFYSSMRRLFRNMAFQNIDSYSLRDSLSLYTGIDLTDFFAFHVFNAGFCDFVIDSLTTVGMNTTVFIRQKSYGTTTLANGNRVWISFFSPQMEREDRLVTFDGAATSASFVLPFVPAFAIVDYDKHLSKAAIGSELAVSSKGTFDLPLSQMKVSVMKVSDSSSSWVYAVHHWCKPDTSESPRYVRMARRYWHISGVFNPEERLNGRFHHSSSLDEGLFSGTSELGMVRVLYREGVGYEWREVAANHAGTSVDGYFVVNNIQPGEYTLAFVDTSVHVSTQVIDGASHELNVYPNPSRGAVTIETGVRGEHLIVDVCDSNGRVVAKALPAVSGESMKLALHDGVYLLNVYRDKGRFVGTAKIHFMNF